MKFMVFFICWAVLRIAQSIDPMPDWMYVLNFIVLTINYLLVAFKQEWNK